MEKLKARMLELGMGFSPIFTGETLRSGKNSCLYFQGHQWESGGKPGFSAVYGDHSLGIHEKWHGDQGELTDEEKRAYEAACKEAEAQRKKERESYQESILPDVQNEWDSYSDLGESPYFSRKGLRGLYGCRIEPHALGPRTVVPARSLDGCLRSYQKISGEKIAGSPDKYFKKGARKEGCFHCLGKLGLPGPIYFCEGIATAASVFEALNHQHTVVCCFDAGNLIHVAKDFRQEMPGQDFIFCADRDENQVGEKKARAAAQAVGLSRVILPSFKEEGSLSDFNDLHQSEGLATVTMQLCQEEERPESGQESQPPVISDTLLKPAAGLGEASLVTKLLESYDRDLLRQGKDYFLWSGTHYEHLDPLASPDRFKKELDRLAQGKLKYKDILSAYNRFTIHVPHVPKDVNLFSPNPLKQNFKNGTLQLHPLPDGSFRTELHPHERGDYLIHCHPFDYCEDAPLNPAFEETVDRIWAGDPDQEAKKRAYFQVLGASLVSAFRKIVVFIGKPKSGKSTLIMFASNMVQKDAKCSVDPTDLSGFNLETMAGKLLNFDTDINGTRAISDSVLKKIEDRIPMRIKRKGIADIYAPIPALHLFGANTMPQSGEGGQAYDRRMLIFRTESYQPDGQNYTQDWANLVWAQGAEGIVRRAIEGLKELCLQKGHFSVPASSHAEMEAWKAGQGDVVDNFLQDIKDGGAVDKNTRIMTGAEYKIERGLLWEFFKNWQANFAGRYETIGKVKFYRRVEELGIKTKAGDKERFFCGLGVSKTPDGLM